MDQFAEFIRSRLPGPGSSVVNSTGLEGGWDFTLTYIFARPAVSASQEASDPSGGLTIVEAVEKQLGVKLEMQKRSMTVTVIDHVEQTPVDN
jgi:uncharacterized protein (TIGR03435 family)